MLFKEKPTADEKRFVQGVLEQSQVIAHAYKLVRRFRQILTERDETAKQASSPAIDPAFLANSEHVRYQRWQIHTRFPFAQWESTDFLCLGLFES